MRVLVFSDIHNDRKALGDLLAMEADLYFAAGDLVSWARGYDSIGEILKNRSGKVYVIPGNHESAEDIERLCEHYGLVDFHGRQMEVAGYHFAGLGYSSPTPFDTPGEYTEAELASRLRPFVGLQPLVMICHAPPLGSTLDEVRPGNHCGSKAVKDFIDAAQPEWFFCGHIHEAAGRRETIGRTQAVNVGKQGFLLEIG